MSHNITPRTILVKRCVRTRRVAWVVRISLPHGTILTIGPVEPVAVGLVVGFCGAFVTGAVALIGYHERSWAVWVADKAGVSPGRVLIRATEAARATDPSDLAPHARNLPVLLSVVALEWRPGPPAGGLGLANSARRVPIRRGSTVGLFRLLCLHDADDVVALGSDEVRGPNPGAPTGYLHGFLPQDPPPDSRFARFLQPRNAWSLIARAGTARRSL